MARYATIVAAATLAVSTPGHGGDAVARAGSARAGADHPLQISIEHGINFSRSALRGKLDGDAQIDPQSGRKITGPQLVDLGGLHFEGRARVTGKPLQPVRIELPTSVVMRTPGGARAELTDFTTDIDGVAMLDAQGELVFRFGARLSTVDAAGGDFRGRIPIRVEYF